MGDPPTEELKDGMGDPPTEEDLTAALIKAVWKDDAAQVRDLLAAGAGVNAVDKDGDTALEVLVCAGGCDDVLEALVEGGADVNHKCVMGLLMTTNDLSLKSLETLINAGADVNATFEDPCCPGRFSTPLHTAIKTLDDDEDYVRALLKAGAATDTRDFAGSTPLIWAGHHGCAESVALLLEAGADIDAIEGKRGSTALLLACRRKTNSAGLLNILEKTVALLTKKGANTDVCDRFKHRTALHYCAELGRAGMVQSLLEAGASRDPRDLQSETPLHLAAEARHVETVTALLRGGAAVDSRNKWDETALHRAVCALSTETVAALLAGGADSRAFDRLGRSPFYMASAIVKQGKDAQRNSSINTVDPRIGKCEEVARVIERFRWGDRCLAVAMALHPRLGGGSAARGLDEELLCMVLARSKLPELPVEDLAEIEPVRSHTLPDFAFSDSDEEEGDEEEEKDKGPDLRIVWMNR